MNHADDTQGFSIRQPADIHALRMRLFHAVMQLDSAQASAASLAAEFSTVAKAALRAAGALRCDVQLIQQQDCCTASVRLVPLGETDDAHASLAGMERVLGFSVVSSQEGCMLHKDYRFASTGLASRVDRAWQILVNKSRDELFQDLNAQNDLLQREISERIAAQKTLEETQRDLIENEKLSALGGLVAGISHEINTPVGICVTAASHLRESINSFTALYQSGSMKRSDLDALLVTVKDIVQMIEVNLDRACELVRSFKAVSVDQTSEDVREFVLAEYVNQVVVSLRPRLRGRQVHVVTDGIDPTITLTTTAGPISQILVNLITNSLVHGFDEGQEGVISISAQLVADTLHLSYSDNGKGIPPENLDKIFDPFFTTKRSHGGSGLGMHLVHNIVTNKFGGRIRCESTPGHGVRFHMTLCGVLG